MLDFAVDHRRELGKNSRYAARALNKPTSGNCKLVVFNKGRRNETVVWRCDNRKLRAHNRNQCRAGSGRSFRAHRFVPRLANGKCPRRA